MNEEGHRSAAAEMRRTLTRLLLPDDIRVYAETSFGAAFHLLAAGAERRYGMHPEHHQGLVRWLRQRGHLREAEVFAQLDTMRTGRWYGKQGNGSAAERMAEPLDEIAAWSLAGEGDR